MRALIATAVAMFAAAAPASAQNYGGNYGGNYGYNGDLIRCESNDNRPRECVTGGGRVVLERQLSNASCIEGRSWGQGRNGIWVSQGCRAEFRVLGYGGGNYGQGNYGYGQTIRCESHDDRTNRCSLPGRGRAVLVRQLSKSSCIEGRTWGSSNGSLWVSQGCRGEFSVSGGYGNNYGFGRVFRCESHDNRTSECAANTRAGIQLVRQLSNSPCIEGRTWGYGRNGIWVSQGCRAEFRSY